MERWREGVRRPSPRSYRDYPSFSSTLLDAIYRSIDETDERGESKERRPSGAPDPFAASKKNAVGVSEKRKTLPSVNYLVINQGRREQSRRRRCTSSSSDGSSYGSFSSSEQESVTASEAAHLRPVRTSSASRSGRLEPAYGPDPLVSSRIDEKMGKEHHGSIRSRLRDLTNGRAPASPGGRLANFLNSLFATKSKASNVSTSVTASSYSQSCLRKTPGTGKRTVSFCPVSVVLGDNCRPCGNKYGHGGNRPLSARRTVMGDDDGDDDDIRSDSSSDLFELKNLAIIGRYRDEFPVYDATRGGNCRSISPGLTNNPYAIPKTGKRQYKERK